jgi:hypothetical protein
MGLMADARGVYPSVPGFAWDGGMGKVGTVGGLLPGLTALEGAGLLLVCVMRGVVAGDETTRLPVAADGLLTSGPAPGPQTAPIGIL